MTSTENRALGPLALAVASLVLLVVGLLARGDLGADLDSTLLARAIVGLGAAVAAVVAVRLRRWWLVAAFAALSLLTPVVYTWTFVLIAPVALIVWALVLGARTRER